MNPNEIEALLGEVRALLKGIDKDETSDVEGWWETEVGAEFGAEKLAALEALLRKRPPA